MSEIIRAKVGQEAEHVVTRMRDEQTGEVAIGNVLRRTCQMMGEGACKQTCQVMTREFDDSEVLREFYFEDPKQCADFNLGQAINGLELDRSDVLMVSVTANNVGFADKLDEYDVTENPRSWRELTGFNAFFARDGEVEALGRRLADCADINFEFKDSEGKTVIGFEHGTRTNMFGESEHRFERDGRKVSYTEYALGLALDHYGAAPESVQIKLAAAIKGHNFTKHFDSREKMEEHIPGWYAAGYVKNVSNPNWQEGDPVVSDDTWEADSRGMIVDDIRAAMQSLNIPEQNFSMDGIIDPGDTKGVHSSHQFSKEYGDTRDLYLTFIPRQNQENQTDNSIQAQQERAYKAFDALIQEGGATAEGIQDLVKDMPDAAEMIFTSDEGLKGQELVDYWDNIGLGQDGFYDDIRKNGCSSCGSHTPGCCDGCA